MLNLPDYATVVTRNRLGDGECVDFLTAPKNEFTEWRDTCCNSSVLIHDGEVREVTLRFPVDDEDSFLDRFDNELEGMVVRFADEGQIPHVEWPSTARTVENSDATLPVSKVEQILESYA